MRICCCFAVSCCCGVAEEGAAAGVELDMVRERSPGVGRAPDPVTDITGDDCLRRDLPASCSPLLDEEPAACDAGAATVPLCSATLALLFAMTILWLYEGREAECLIPA